MLENRNEKERRGNLVGVMGARVEAKEDHVALVIELPEGNSLGLRFYSPTQVLTCTAELVEAAANLWPENEFLKLYFEEDDDDGAE